MKKIITLLIVLVITLSSVTSVYAADGKVIYDGKARDFIFEQGSDYSPTDLFDNFKDVMPGDTLTQKITVKNDEANKVKVKLYIRSLGAHKDSEEFLSHLSLKVQKSEDNEMAYMFDAPADQTAQLTEWVYLGTLYSGGEVNLDITLDVPVELDNEFQNAVGYLDWEFKAEEFPTEDTDPKPPQTGDNNHIRLWLIIMIIALCTVIVLIVLSKKNKEQQEDTDKLG